MQSDRNKTSAWLAELTTEVNAELERRRAGRGDRRPALEAELQQIDDDAQGWSITLANKQLPLAVREEIERRWGAGLERRREIEAELGTLSQAEESAEQILKPQEVAARLERLTDVLATSDPTRGNLELSLHIDRITGRRDGTVELRMCKLGIVPDAVRMLEAADGSPSSTAVAPPSESRARRRGKLRVVAEDAEVDLHAQASFVAAVDRFAGLGDQWFWIDRWMIPRAKSWAAENAAAVFRRRQEALLSYDRLAAEFGVTAPTIGAAVRHYLQEHPAATDIELPRGGAGRPHDLS